MNKKLVSGGWLNDAIPDAVTMAVNDPDRVCPMFAGPSIIKAKQLTVRLADRDIEVSADKFLLDSVVRLCDGTRTISEMVETIRNKRQRQRFVRFLHFLMEEGSLIDSALYTLAAIRFGAHPNLFGRTADYLISDSICERFLSGDAGRGATPKLRQEEIASSPLTSFFESRISTRTFDDRSISLEQLTTLLWSLCGVISARHERASHVMPRRTIASAGGMHLIYVYVVLQRAVGSYVPGVYRVHYTNECRIALELVADDFRLLPRAFNRPWELTFATASIFFVGDVVTASIRYRNRALQYLFMETGAALHNGALTAPALNLAYCIVGDYSESVVETLCRTHEGAVLGSAIFGPAPTHEQLALLSNCPDVEFGWADVSSTIYSMPCFMGRAKIKKQGAEEIYTWGRSSDAKHAYTKAIAEAIERDGFCTPRNVFPGRITDFSNAIDPRQFIRYSERQYRSKNFPYRPFSTSKMYYWVAGAAVLTERPVSVLAEMVYPLTGLPKLADSAGRYTQTNSSGCAAGVSRDDALFRAVLELVERDAFMRHWMMQVPGSALIINTLPAQLLSRVKALKAAGCDVVVQKLDSQWANVCLVSAQHISLHFTCIGAAARPSLEQAIGGALDELEARVYAWLHGEEAGALKPNDVLSPEHHFKLYGIKHYYRRADRVLKPKKIMKYDKYQDGKFKSLETLCGALTKSGHEPAFVDITPQRCGIEQGRKKLTVVKAMVPSLVPVSFGCGREPEGLFERVHKDSRFPHPFP